MMFKAVLYLNKEEAFMVNYFISNALMLIGIISIGFSVYQVFRNYFNKHPRLLKILFGLFAGVAGAFLMNQSYETSSGVLVGYRNYNLGIAAIFGGFLPVFIAAVLMFINRVLSIGFNETTTMLLITLAVLTLSSTFISKYVKKLVYQWVYFSTINVLMTSIALYLLLHDVPGAFDSFLYYYIGHLLLPIIIYMILKYFIAYTKSYNRLAEESIIYTHDPHTGLLNRNGFRQFLEFDSKQISLKDKTIICLDIDNFRLVNEALGHEIGDFLIKEFASKITESVHDKGKVYHMDGDEFLILLETVDVNFIDGLTKKILQNISTQMLIQNRTYIITASMGVSTQSEEDSMKDVLDKAEMALYMAKKQKNTIVLYSKDMAKSRTRALIIEEDLRTALDNHQFELYFQPIYDVNKGVINQAEALLRWHHPEFGLISPMEFIPIAEKTKLILPITDWVINESCLQLASWNKIGIDGIVVSVNLSYLSFENRSDQLLKNLNHSIQSAGINPANLKLEITESTLIHNTNELMEVFNEIKQLGVKLALDDFGTGYSSLGYLKDLPMDIIKLDRSLINYIVKNKKSQMIVSSLIMIIHGLGLEVVVEGVETKEQYDILCQYKSDYIQGYLFSKPLPKKEFIDYYINHQQDSNKNEV